MAKNPVTQHRMAAATGVHHQKVPMPYVLRMPGAIERMRCCYAISLCSGWISLIDSVVFNVTMLLEVLVSTGATFSTAVR